jgi:hypothetical protein
LPPPADIPVEIAQCGGAGCLDLHPDFAALPLDDQVRLVQAAWQSPLPRLLVFDNCEDEALLARWKPPSGGCRILVTSRRPTWDPTLNVRPLPLGVLSRAESLALLCHYLPDLPVDATDLSAIADELGDLPLALHLAGSFLARYHRSMTPAEYLEALRRPDLLTHHSLQGRGLTYSPTHHELHVARTFALSLERLDSTVAADALARQLLARAAHFAPGVPIPPDLLLKTLELPDTDSDLLQSEDALHRLTDLGLLEPEANDALRLHRLLATFIRATVHDSTAQPAVESTILEAARHLNSTGYPARLLDWQPHLRTVTDAARARLDERAAGLCNELGYHLSLIGKYPDAHLYYERALAIHEQTLGPEHPTSQIVRRNLIALDAALERQKKGQ